MLKHALLAVFICDVTARTILDLTHTFDENAPKYPLTSFGAENITYFGLDTLSAKWYPNGMWLSLKKVEFYEHLGTHMDAPLHFGYGKQTMSEIPPEKLIGPGVMINIRDKVVDNPNYAVTIDDVKEYEKQYGEIPPNAIVMMNSGWAEKYGNSEMVFGTDNLEDPTSFNFPGWHIDTCKYLLTERRISVLGVDTPSTDPANLPEYLCHMYLQPNNVPLLEYVANLDTMPAAGSTIVLGSMKHRGGTGGPVRILAIVDDDDVSVRSGSKVVQVSVALRILVSVFLLLLGKWRF